MKWQDRIIVNPEVLAGKPIVKGTRLAADFILELLAADWTEAEILANYPQLTHADLSAVFAYAAERLASERIYPLAG
jgi:uncharacterized protein (DUF433 family)